MDGDVVPRYLNADRGHHRIKLKVRATMVRRWAKERLIYGLKIRAIRFGISGLADSSKLTSFGTEL
ncbi:MAG: hypothetical protein ABL928_14830, partial [Sphingorhabdus sp.]